MKILALTTVLWLLSVSAFAGPQIRSFSSGSYQQIVSHQQQIFVMVFWSLDCPPCYKELEMLGRFSKQYPAIKLVLVSTDISVSKNEILAVLTKYQLENTESWVFTGNSEERLRFEIDVTWYGELPRSYLIKHSEQIQVVSGVLEEAKLIKMLSDYQ